MLIPKIILVDDDDDLTAAIEFLFSAKKWDLIRFTSGENFIVGLEDDLTLIDHVGAILLDIRMTGLSGYDVFSWIQKHHPMPVMPIIFLTGHGELPEAIQLMKRGAFDFITKPFESNHLIRVVSDAIKKSTSIYREFKTSISILEKISLLTDKELMVMKRIYSGDSNKLIADLLGNSTRTVELHRAAIFHKLEVKNAIEMVRQLDAIGFKCA